MGTLLSTLRRKHRASPRLPLELLVIIEEFLVGDNLFRTAANLNRTCQVVYEETRPILYAAVVMQYEYFVRSARCGSDKLKQSSYRELVK